MSNVASCCFRHNSFCKPGMWVANLSIALGYTNAGWHLHAHCVVDDFGTLVPIEITGLTFQSKLVTSQL